VAINYGLLDTTTPAQIGALPGNTLAKFLQNRQQVEDRTLAREEAGTRNALARMQLTRGEREMAEEDAYKNALAGVQGVDYEGAMPRLLQASPTRALALKKSVNEGQQSGLETQIKRFELIDRAAGQFAANPTRQTGVWVLSQLAANGTPPEVIQQMSAKLNAAHDEDLPRMAQAFLSSTQEGMKAKIAQMYPKPAQQTSSTLGRLLAERDSLPSGDPRRAQYDQAIVMETTRKEPAPYVQFLPSAEGYLRGNTRTGQVTPVTVGGPPRAPPAAPAPGASPGPAAPPVAPATPARTPMPAASDPDLQARLAAAKARGTAEGEATAKAQGDLPRATAQADELLQLTEELLAHPGLGQAVGTSSVLGVQKIPGTDARDFSIRLEQIRGKQFLEAFQALKGSGAITETEGKKATEAIARMDTSSSEPEFKRAVSDFQGVVRAGLGRTKARASDGKPSAPAAPRGADTMPPPAEHTGRIIRDSSTGVRYRSDGSAWLRVQ
jgi:nitrogen fixation protein FixH